MMSQQFLCTHCKQEVEEDQSAMPKKDSRLLLAKFNEQLEPLFVLLRQVEGIKLAPELLEPEPVDISAIKGSDKKSNQIIRTGNEQWSGELTRNQGFRVEETRVNVTIAEETIQSQSARKERPVWMTQSTIINQDIVDNKTDLTLSTPTLVETNEKMVNKTGEDIMSVLLQHEKRDQNAADAVKAVMKNQTNSDSSDDESKTFDPDARGECSLINYYCALISIISTCQAQQRFLKFILSLPGYLSFLHEFKYKFQIYLKFSRLDQEAFNFVQIHPFFHFS